MNSDAKILTGIVAAIGLVGLLFFSTIIFASCSARVELSSSGNTVSAREATSGRSSEPTSNEYVQTCCGRLPKHADWIEVYNHGALVRRIENVINVDINCRRNSRIVYTFTTRENRVITIIGNMSSMAFHYERRR